MQHSQVSRFPWMSRATHAAITALLSSQIDELKAERRLLLDRLAVLGLGGALFATDAEPVEHEAAEEEAAGESETASEAAQLEELLRLRRRPSALADRITRMQQRRPQRPGTRTAWVAQDAAVTAALDAAEALGKRQD